MVKRRFSVAKKASRDLTTRYVMRVLAGKPTKRIEAKLRKKAAKRK